VRVRQIEVLSLACPRLDAESGVTLLALVKGSVERGARSVILDFGPLTFIDLDGALAVGAARVRLGEAGSLVLSGLCPRARAVLLAAGVAGSVRMVDWWTDAVEPATRVA
jgi:anti-anti-sigma regulatory factor